MALSALAQVADKHCGLRAAFTGGKMKLIALKPIYFGGTVVTEGLPLETLEQQQEQPEVKAEKKAKK